MGNSLSIPATDHHLLWTGGWDSTFQLLRLLTIYRERVTPFYLIDAERSSTGLELRAMKRVKDRLSGEYPHTRELLQPTRYFGVDDIAPDPEITEAFVSTSNKTHIGAQYEWLARFCKQNALTDMQLCIDAGSSKAYHRIKPFVTQVETPSHKTHRIDPKHAMTPEYELFRFYSLPVFGLTKLDMLSIAEEQGWNGIMEMTWFCHHPRGDMKPCGRCFPCISVIEEGLGWRIPVSSRIAYALDRDIVNRLSSCARRIVSRRGAVRS